MLDSLSAQAYNEFVKNRHAVALGRLGGLKGGPARAASLTKRERAGQARHAARARWLGRSLERLLSLLKTTNLLASARIAR